MPLISQSLVNLVNGVSQQPAPLRSPSQAELVENAWQHAFGGSDKRPPSFYLAKISGTVSPSSGDVFFPMRLSDGSEYLVFASGASGSETIRVWNSAGTEQTVTAPSGFGYLTYTTTNQLKYLTVGDTTFIVNPKKVPAMSGSLSATRNPEALVWIKQSNPPGSPGCIYTITLDGFTASLDDRSYNQATSWGTADIATSLRANLITALGGSAALYTITASESYIYITRVNGADFALAVKDTRGNEWSEVIKGKAKLISDLPLKCQSGFTLTITGDAGSTKDDYYVSFVCEDPAITFGRGSWRETIKPGIAYQIDASTMPYQLTKTGASTFTFQQVTWNNRTVGDTTTAPTPSFIGKAITELFFFKNRIGLVSGSANITMSRAADYYAFFPKTVIAYQDENPIDVTIDIGESSNIYHATPTNEGCILWGDRSQHLLKGGDILSPKTVQSYKITSFECEKTVKPVAIGQNFYFLTPLSPITNDCRVMEFFYDLTSQNHDAADITAHCPKVARSIYPRLISAPRYNTLFQWDSTITQATFNDDSSKFEMPTLKLYRYHWNGNDKIQSSWSHWYFDGGGLGTAETTFQTLKASARIYWAMEETSGSVAADANGNTDVNGQIGSDVSVNSAGMRNKGYLCSGAGNNYITTNPVAWAGINLPSADTDAFTAVCWFRTSSATNQVLTCRRNSANGSWMCIMDNTGRIGFNSYDGVGFCYGADWWDNSAPGTWNDGQWHCCAVVKNYNVLKIYIDGTLRSHVTGSTARAGLSLSQPFIAGMQLWTLGDFLNGGIDEVGYWTRELTSDEIAALYSSSGGSARGCVFGAAFLGSKLYLMMRRSQGGYTGPYYLEYIDINPDWADNFTQSSDYNIDHHTLLDRQVDAANCSPAYNATSGLTTWTLPYRSMNTMRVVLKATGAEIPCTNVIHSDAVTAVGNYTSSAAWIGQEYTFKYRPSKQYLKDQHGAVNTDGRLQYQQWTVYYDKTGYLAVSVTPQYRSAYTYTAVSANPTLSSGKYKFPVHCTNEEATIDITSNHWLPCRILSLEYKANYFSTHQRNG